MIIKAVTKSKKYIALALLLNTGILEVKGSNPFGVLWAPEIFYLFLILFTMYYLYQEGLRGNPTRSVDFSVILIVAVAFCYTPFISWFLHGQPIEFGFLESRKTLGLLVYFPIIYAIKRGHCDIRNVILLTIVVGLMCAVAAFIGALFFNEISGRAFESSLAARTGVGTVSVGLAIVFASYCYVETKQIRYLFIFCLLLVVLVVVIQTRQVIIASMLASLYIFGVKRGLIFGFAAVYLVLVFGLESQSFVGFIETISPRLLQLLDPEYYTRSNRASVASVAWDAVIRDSPFFGLGALSSYWNRGYLYVFGPGFWLADSGMIGAYFKYGAFAGLFYLVYLKVQITELVKIRDHYLFSAIFAGWSMLMIMWPVAGIIEYRGHIAGPLLALTAGAYLDVLYGDSP